MIMGIRNTLLVTLIAGATVYSTVTEASTREEMTNNIYNFCRDLGGTDGEPEYYEEGGKECAKWKCAIGTENVDASTDGGNLEFKNAKKYEMQAIAGGYKRVCVNKQELDEVAERAREEARRRALEAEFEVEGSGNGGGVDGGVSGDGSYVLRFDGRSYTCNVSKKKRRSGPPGKGRTTRRTVRESEKDCLARHDVDLDFDVEFVLSGDLDSDGRRIYVVRKRRSGGDYDDDDGGSYRTVRRGSGGRTSGPRGRRGRSDRDIIVDGGYDIEVNGRLFSCAAGESERECLGDDLYYQLMVEGDWENCIHCDRRTYRRSSGSSVGEWGTAIAQVAGAILPPLAYYHGQRVSANAYLQSNLAYANAATSGFENCRQMQTSYVDQMTTYISANELPDRDITVPTCQGYNLNAYAGGGWNGSMYGRGIWGGSGYSPGFMAGMQGPYGSGYMTGIGMNGMMMNPYSGLGVSGSLNLNSLFGLPAGGITFGGGTNGMYGHGMYGSPYSTLPYTSGVGVGVTGGISMPGLHFGAGSSYGPMGNAWASSNGLVPYGNSMGSMYGTSYPYNGGQGSLNGSNWWSVQQSYQNNAQAAMVGDYYQQAALQNQYNRATSNLMNYQPSGYSYNSMMSPMHMGGSLQAGFQFGWP